MCNYTASSSSSPTNWSTATAALRILNSFFVLSWQVKTQLNWTWASTNSMLQVHKVPHSHWTSPAKHILGKRNDEWLVDNPRVKIGVVGMDRLHDVTCVVLNSSMLSVKINTKMTLNEDVLKEPTSPVTVLNMVLQEKTFTSCTNSLGKFRIRHSTHVCLTGKFWSLKA